MPREMVGDEHLFLYGHASFKEYIKVMSGQPDHDRSSVMKRWTDDWRVANERLQDLKIYEAAWADEPPIKPVPREVQPLVQHVLDDPIYQRSFSYGEVEIGVVELDRLVVWQTLNNLVHVQRLKTQLGPHPSADTVFRFCLPYDHPVAEHRQARISDHTFSFVSDSTDMRFLEAVLLRPDQIVNYRSYGPIAGVVALVVGYGSNYLNVIAAEGRIVLNNGYHRAYTLRALGITHVPCLIQKVNTRDELSYLASGGLRRHPDFYLNNPRPPVLKDYFDPIFWRKVIVTNNTRQIRLSYSADETNIP